VSTQTAATPLSRRDAPPAFEPPGPDADQGYTVRQAAQLTGLSEHTLRYYERARLLGSVRRQRSSRHRRYSADDIARLQTLACLRAAGMPLDRMRRYFELVKQGAAAAPLQVAMLAEQRGVLRGRVRDLESHLRYLEDKIAYWKAVEIGDTEQMAEIVRRISCHLRTTNSL
jgi:DNA-binding transcriptional MerR regulator